MLFIIFFFVLTSSLFYQVLGETIHITTEYLTNEEKVVMANSKVDVLEAKTSKLRKEMIMTMDNRNQMKEQIKALIDDLKAENLLPKQKDEQLQEPNHEVSIVGDNAVQAFQLTDKYNYVLLNWYFKGLELLRRYLMKHKLEEDLESLDFEAVDKEMEADEANVVEGVVPEVNADKGIDDGQDSPAA